MAKRVQLRRGTTAQTNAFTGALSEVTVDTEKDVLVVHDGVTAGGFPVAARANADGTISLIKKDGTIIGSINATGLFNNTLTSTATDQALTAAQGKVLKDLVDTKQASSTAFGVGQTYQDVTASRVLGTTYTNSTNKDIWVSVSVALNAGVTLAAYVNGNQVCNGFAQQSNSQAWAGLLVPPSGTYSVSGSSIVKWMERR